MIEVSSLASPEPACCSVLDCSDVAKVESTADVVGEVTIEDYVAGKKIAVRPFNPQICKYVEYWHTILQFEGM